MSIEYFDFIVDLDGTIADCSHRVGLVKTKPKNYDAFYAGVYEDAVIEETLTVVKALCARPHTRALIVTGRPMQTYKDTVDWLLDKATWPHWERIYMRRDGDYRPDHLIKRELLVAIRGDGYNPVVAFDDRTRVVEMWRENGIRCMQVEKGDF